MPVEDLLPLTQDREKYYTYLRDTIDAYIQTGRTEDLNEVLSTIYPPPRQRRWTDAFRISPYRLVNLGVLLGSAVVVYLAGIWFQTLLMEGGLLAHTVTTSATHLHARVLPALAEYDATLKQLEERVKLLEAQVATPPKG